jgi:hypothetical protein
MPELNNPTYNKTRLSVIFFIMFLSVCPVFGQEYQNDSLQNTTLPLVVTVEPEMGDAKGTFVVISKSGEKPDSFQFDKKNYFTYDFPLGSNYSINLRKFGYYPKGIAVETFVPAESLEANDYFPELEIDIKLYRKHREIEREFQNFNQTGILSYNKNIEDFEFVDYGYEDEIVKQAETLRQEKGKRYKLFEKQLIEADQLIDEGKFTIAQKTYETIQETFPEFQLPEGHIKYVKQNVEKQKIEAQQKRQEFENLVTQADSLFEQQRLNESLEYFTQALKIFPDNELVRSKHRKIQRHLALEQEKRRLKVVNLYRDIILEADNAFRHKNYDLADSLYKQAKQIQPRESYPDEMLRKIDAFISYELNYKTENQSLKNWYQEQLSLAEQAFAQQKYIESKNIYQKILRFQKVKKYKKDDPYPRKRIFEIEKYLLAKGEAYNDSLTRLKSFQSFVKDGDISFKLKLYPASKRAYQNALSIFPNDVKAKQKLVHVDSVLQANLQDEKIFARKTELYNQALKNAEYALRNAQQDSALQYLNLALQYFPESTYPQIQIDQINSKKREKENQKYRQEVKRESYLVLIEEADRSLSYGEFHKAKDLYIKAIKTDPEQEYPRQKVKEIEAIVTEQQKENIARNAHQESYQNLIQGGGRFLREKEYAKAKQYFEHALNLRPNENLPRQKLDEINRIYELHLRSEKAKLEKFKLYDKHIRLGDASYARKEYEEAKKHYKSSLEYYPEATYPNEKIHDLNIILGQLIATKEKIETKKSNYQDYIKQGEFAFKDENYQQAREHFNSALLLFPDSTYPKLKLRNIDNIIFGKIEEEQKNKQIQAKLNNLMQLSEAAAKAENYDDAITYLNQVKEIDNTDISITKKLEELEQKAIQKKKEKQELEMQKNEYETLLSQAEQFFFNKDYENSLMKFKEAGEILPNKEYVKNRIQDIKHILDKTEEMFSEALKNGDKAFEDEKYSVARFYYEKAREIRKNNELDQKIELTQQKIDEFKSKIREDEYKDYIMEAEIAFRKKQYSVAEFYFSKAYAVKSGSYPKEKIDEIKLIRKRQAEEQKEKQYHEAVSKADQAFQSKEFGVARFYYNQAIEIKNNEKYPYSQLQQIEAMIGNNKKY